MKRKGRSSIAIVEVTQGHGIIMMPCQWGNHRDNLNKETLVRLSSLSWSLLMHRLKTDAESL
jgi:hypothetical protein